ncbi:MAG: type III PLP-dependent enzyme [Alphaproteobacteria bacterium]|nr:type III PLP-dependent enzyme [Alphaproteobacteria bacterium]
MPDPSFASVPDMLASLRPSYPVMCFWPERIAITARRFLNGFPGKVLYAVKCNPHAIVLKAMHDAGIRDFDTASLNEIALVNERFSDVSCYFNHPVKSRAAIDSAVRVYGVNDFVVDHPSELKKLIDIAGPGHIIQVRLRTPGGVATFDLSAKFGADEDAGVELLREVVARQSRPAVSFHVGSQCRKASAYGKAFEIVARVLDRAGVTPEYINVGGGFPVSDAEVKAPSLEEFFSQISESATRYGYLGKVPLLCEPGRGMVADAASLITQVHLRKDNQLYLNEGIYGSLSEIVYGDLRPPLQAIRLRGPLSDEMRPFTLFGPTCDSNDVVPHQFALPKDISEGDWIEVGGVGAYSNALQSSFNGFTTDTFVAIRGATPSALAL